MKFYTQQNNLQKEKKKKKKTLSDNQKMRKVSATQLVLPENIKEVLKKESRPDEKPDLHKAQESQWKSMRMWKTKKPRDRINEAKSQGNKIA